MQKKSSRPRPPRRVGLARRVALAAGALVLVPTLGSCGFDYATDAIYTQSTGVNDRTGDVDVLNALIVSGEQGSGTFLATFVHNDRTETATFEGINGDLQASDVQPLEIPRSDVGSLSLVDEEPITVTGDFEAGQFVEVRLSFGNGQVTEIQVPVVPETGEHEGLDRSGSGASPTDEGP